MLFREDDGTLIIDDVTFGSVAETAGLDWDKEVSRVLRTVAQPTKHLIFPALILLGLIIFLQRGRKVHAPQRPEED